MPAGPQAADRGPCHFCELFGGFRQAREKGPVRQDGFALERYYILFHGFWRICRYVGTSVYRYVGMSIFRYIGISVYGYVDISMVNMSVYRYIGISVC